MNGVVYQNVPALLRTQGVSHLDATRDTLKWMVRIVRKYKSDAGTVMAARQILNAAHVPERNVASQIRALQAYVRDHITYVPDPRRVEMVQTPPQTLTIRTGDCDDKATLLATLLESVNLPTRFVAMGFQDGAAHGMTAYSHVLNEVQLHGQWIPLETIVPGLAPGRIPAGVKVTRLMVLHV